MFSYPLPPVSETEYARLGVGPEASAQEIGDAQSELKSRLNGRKVALSKQVEGVLAEVSGLREAYDALAALQRDGETVDRTRHREAHRRVVELEQEALRREPRFTSWRREIEDIDTQIQAINRMNLQSRESRLEYDQGHPPLELIKLEECTRDAWVRKPKVAMALLRRELAAYFHDRGEPVFHPSDLTRRHFDDDFAYHPLLDDEDA